MRPASRLERGFIATAMALVGVLASSTTPVSADTKPITITGDVYIHSTPDTSVASRLTVMQKGSHPDYVCYTRAEDVGGTNVWFDVRWNGVEGFYSSYLDDVPLSAQSDLEDNYGIHYCGTGSEMNQGAGADGTINLPSSQPLTYDRDAAVAWAQAHVYDQQSPLWSECTWFVSHALWAGGFARNADWTDEGSHQSRVRTLPGTVIATGAPDLVSYLQSMNWVTSRTLTSDDFRNNAVPDARPGDIIAYKWDGGDGNEHIDHLAFVVDIAPGQYPEVAEWGTNKLPSLYVSYPKRGWTYSVNSGTWLQTNHPDVTAILLHVNF